MESKNSSLAILHEPFVAGMDENLSPIMQRLWKLEGGAIYFCRSGWAHVTIDLKDYEIVENTQIVLLPGTIIRINGNSSDFTASFFGFPKEMFREACLRFEPIFFRFIKEKPCYTLKDESTGAINGLMRATTAIYNDRENRFRNQIAKNHYRNLDVGNPIIVVVGPGDFTTDGHFLVLTGHDGDKITLNDPNSPTNSQKSWDYDTLAGQIQSLWVLRRAG